MYSAYNGFTPKDPRQQAMVTDHEALHRDAATHRAMQSDETVLRPIDLETIMSSKAAVKYWYLHRPKTMEYVHKNVVKIQSLGRAYAIRSLKEKYGIEYVVALAKADAEKKEAERLAEMSDHERELKAQADAEYNAKVEEARRVRREQVERERLAEEALRAKLAEEQRLRDETAAEAKRIADEQAEQERLAQEAAAERMRIAREEEAERQRIQQEKDEEERRVEEEKEKERQRIEEEARLAALALEEERRHEEEEAERARIEEEERAKAEAEAQRIAEEEEAARQAALLKEQEEEAARQAAILKEQEEEAARQAAIRQQQEEEAEAARVAAEEEAARLAFEEAEAARIAEEERVRAAKEKKRRAAEEAERQRMAAIEQQKDEQYEQSLSKDVPVVVRDHGPGRVVKYDRDTETYTVQMMDAMGGFKVQAIAADVDLDEDRILSPRTKVDTPFGTGEVVGLDPHVGCYAINTEINAPEGEQFLAFVQIGDVEVHEEEEEERAIVEDASIPIPDEIGLVAARIVDSRVVNRTGKKFIQYKLEIKTTNYGVVYCWKRYSTFRSLCDRLRKEAGYSKRDIPELPHRHIMGNFNENTIGDRAEKLNVFLSAAVHAEHLQWGIRVDDQIAVYKRRVKHPNSTSTYGSRSGATASSASSSRSTTSRTSRGFFSRRR